MIETQSQSSSSPKKTRRKIGNVFVVFILLIVTFTLGILVGNDKVKLNSVESLTSSNSSSDISKETINELQELWDELRKNYDGEIKDEDILEGLKKGAVEAVGDTYTTYLSETETKEFNDDLDGKFEGIGAELSEENGLITIVAPIKGAPAEKAGIRPGDVIVEIEGEDSLDITVYEAVKRIRGEKGTDVKLGIVRDGERLDVTITRDTIDIPSVEWRKDGDIGIIEISRFGNDTTELTAKAAKEFNDAGLKKIILDMRGNPGGLLDQAVGVANVWLSKNSVVLEEKRGEEVIKSYRTQGEPIFSGVKTVVLINEGSASASEIVAGALKDNNVAVLYGEKSFGKGSVQRLINLDGGGSLKVTIARWFTPGGKNIDKEGIEPDEKVELTNEDRDNDRDPQLDAAKSALNN